MQAVRTSGLLSGLFMLLLWTVAAIAYSPADFRKLLFADDRRQCCAENSLTPNHSGVGARTVLSRNTFIQSDLGITVADISPALRRKFRIKTMTGVVVTHVRQDSPASAAGMKRGDVIKSIDVKPVRTLKDFRSAIGYWERGREVEFMIRRANRKEYVVIGTDRNQI